MDEHTAKKAFGGRLSVARRGPGLTSGESSNYKDGSRQCCNRLGCSTRFYSMKSSQVGTSDVAKNLKPSFRSTSSKSLVGCSSKKYYAVRDLRKPLQEPQKTVSAESSNSQAEMEISEGVSSITHAQPWFPETKDVEPEVVEGLSVDESEEVGSCSEMRNAKKKKPVTKRSELGNQNVASSSRRTFVSKSIRQAAKSATSGCSSSNLSYSGKVEVTKKTNDSFRGKINRSSCKESSGTSSNSMSNSNSGSECSSSSQQTPRTGNRPASKDASGSVRIRSANGGNRARVSRHGKGSSLSLADSPVVPPHLPQNGLSIGRSSVNSSRNLSHREHNTVHRNSYARPSQNGRSRNVSNQLEDDPSHSFHDCSIGRDGFRRSNMEGIGEVLFALEMIEQDEELTHERNLDQLEALSKKLKAKTLRTEAPAQSIAATRLLAREGLNAEQLARDLKSFELKTTFEDVFPAEATSVEEYLQQVHEMAMVSAIQEAQKDNVRCFNDYMVHVLEEDWQKEKLDFLQSMSHLSTLPRTNSSAGITRAGQIVPVTSGSQVSTRPSSMDLVHVTNKSILEKKASVYAEVVMNLNSARERALPFKPATAFKAAYEGLGLEVSGGKSVSMQKIWHLIQTLVAENSVIQRNVSKKMSLIIGARRHLEWGHEKYILDTIQSNPVQAALGGVVGNLQRIRAFLRIRLRDYGVLDFDAGDTRRHPPIDTTWQQIYFCLRTGYYDEARNVALSSRVSHQFAPQLAEWITTGGMVSAETASAASEECEKMLRIGDRAGRAGYDKKKLLLYAIISGSRRQIDWILRDTPSLFSTIEDFLWFKLSAVRDSPGAGSVVLNEGMVPYSLDDLQVYLNKFEPSYYTKNGKDPLVYPYVLLLSIQLLPAVLYLLKETGEEGLNIDAVHISIVLADHGVPSEGAGTGSKLGVMDAFAEVASIIRQYGSAYLRSGDLALALEYYAQAAAAMGGGLLSWTGRGSSHQQRQKQLMLKQLLTELLLRDGGIPLLLGLRGAGEEGELRRFISDARAREQFLLEAAQQCQEAGLYEKSVEIQKRIGAFSMALETINKCLSEAICSLTRGRLDGDSQTAGLIHSGNEILEMYKYSGEASLQEREHVLEQQTVLRQLEAILHIHKLARAGQYTDALREVTKLSFFPLDPRGPDVTPDALRSLSSYVQACVPDLLKVALSCMDNVTDTDGLLRALRSKIANIVANNMSRNWPRDLYDKVARSF